jgi:signal transduction histidine kinase/transcriptional regulator with XRE-family HTH domain
MARDEANLPEFGMFIRQQRTHLNLTQVQLAERLGWTQERISVLEHGRYGMPSLPALVRLAEALEVPTLALLEHLGFPADPLDSAPGGGERERDSTALQYTLQRLLAIEAMTLKDALDQASDEMALAMGAEKIDAFVFDAPSNSLVALGTSNTPMGHLQHQSGLHRVPLANRDRTGQVYQSGQGFYTGDAQNDPDLSRGVKETMGVHSFLAVPLRAHTTVIGVLVAESSFPNRFSPDEQQFFASASHWVGMIAHRAELIERMRRAVEEESRKKAADEIIDALARDLGSILTPLRGRLDLLTSRLARLDQPRELEHARAAVRAVEQIDQLITSLLDISRLDHGLFTLATQPLDLAGLVTEVASQFQLSRPELIVRTSEQVPDVEGDPVRLREVLLTLVTNAVQHSPDGSPITLAAGTERRDDGVWAVISVTDEGSGIEAEMLPRLFQRFTRGLQAGGRGLGLYLARRLVEAHGGTLTVESAVGRGTTFWLALPASLV